MNNIPNEANLDDDPWELEPPPEPPKRPSVDKGIVVRVDTQEIIEVERKPAFEGAGKLSPKAEEIIASMLRRTKPNTPA